MTHTKLVMALPALFVFSLSVAAEMPTDFKPAVPGPDIESVLKNPELKDGWSKVETDWKAKPLVTAGTNAYVEGKTMTRHWFGLQQQEVWIDTGSYSLNNQVDSVQVTIRDKAIAANTTIRGTVVDPNDATKIYKGFLALESGAVAHHTIVEENGSLSVRSGSKAYDTYVGKGGQQIVTGYAQANKIDGGYQQLTVASQAIAEDTIVINGGEQWVYGGTTINTHIGDKSFQLVSGISTNTTLYAGATQEIYSGSGDDRVVDTNTIVLAGAKQYVSAGVSDGAQIYGLQIVTSQDGTWQDGAWVSRGRQHSGTQSVTNATIHAGGLQIVQTGTVDNITVHGEQLLSGQKGDWVDGEWAFAGGWVGKRPQATNTTVKTGGIQRVTYYAEATDTVVDGGTQIVEDRGHVTNTTIQGGGSATIMYGGYATGTTQVNDGVLNMQAGGTHDWTGDLGQGAFASHVVLADEHSRLNVQYNTATDVSAATIGRLEMQGGTVAFAQTSRAAGQYSRLVMENLSGTGTFLMNTGIAEGQGDFLEVTNTVSGQFQVRVQDTGVEPGTASAHHLIHAGQSANDSFTLVNGTVDLGAYKYSLVQGEAADADNWYLAPALLEEPQDPDPGPDPDPDPGPDPVDPDPMPEVPGPTPGPGVYKPSEAVKAASVLASATPQVWDAELSTLRTRLGDLRDTEPQSGAWGKFIASKYKTTLQYTNYDQDINGVMVGLDKAIALKDSRLLVGGLFSFSRAEMDSSTADNKINSYAFGLYVTWMADNGVYIDGVAKINRFNTESHVRVNGASANGKDNLTGYGVSLELGRHIKVNDYFFEPYVMGSFFHVEKSKYGMDNVLDGIKIEAAAVNSVKGELGISAGKKFTLDNGAIVKPYVRLAVQREFRSDNDVTVNGHRFVHSMSGTSGKYGVGVTAQLDKKWGLYAEVNYAKGSDVEMPYSGNFGVRFNF